MVRHRTLKWICLFSFLLIFSITAFSSQDGQALMGGLDKTFTGDLKQIEKRGFLRILTSYNQTNYFTTLGRERGFEYDMMEQYRQYLNDRSSREIVFVYIPTPFDELLDKLNSGYGDVAASGLTITSDRQAKVAFTNPYLPRVDEIIVTHRNVPPIRNLEDLAGRRVYVISGSSYAEHLYDMNRQFRAKGLLPMVVIESHKHLESEDLLEMVNAGIIPRMVVDDHVARLWSGALDNIVLLDNIPVHEGGQLAWAVRQNSNDLRKSLNGFVAENKKGTLIGNILFKRYYTNTLWVTNPLSTNDLKKFRELVPLFKKYGEMYGFDWLLLAAQGYQESQLKQSTRSYAGAVGIMQVLPSTAAAPEVGIPNIYEVENNIHAGAKYMAWLRDKHFNEPGLAPEVRVHFALGAYNAGPGNMRKFRRLARQRGLDPDQWFYNVARMADETVGEQPVRYVANIHKYYMAYKLIIETGNADLLELYGQ
ncbi:MAG: MltF family protein [Planctomycetota bacterium]|jgi:membrane-bound lytic murein transglycosylase MltF